MATDDMEMMMVDETQMQRKKIKEMSDDEYKEYKRNKLREYRANKPEYKQYAKDYEERVKQDPVKLEKKRKYMRDYMKESVMARKTLKELISQGVYVPSASA
jgi:hypothetical protein